MTNTVVRVLIVVGSVSFGLAITPDGQSVYVVNNASHNVSHIDLLINTVIGPSIPVSSNPAQIAITPDGATAYVANSNRSDPFFRRGKGGGSERLLITCFEILS